MSYATWSSIFVISLLTAIFPGPGSILTMSYGLKYGWKNTTSVIIGQEIALILIVILAGTSSNIILESTKILTCVKLLGAIWLIYTGWQTWNAPIIALKKDFTAINSIHKNNKKYFISMQDITIGFITNITNVKAIIFMISIMPQFINIEYSVFIQIIVIMLTIVFVDTIMMYIYAIAASSIQNIMQEPKMIKFQNRLFGTILIFFGISVIYIIK